MLLPLVEEPEARDEPPANGCQLVPVRLFRLRDPVDNDRVLFAPDEEPCPCFYKPETEEKQQKTRSFFNASFIENNNNRPLLRSLKTIIIATKSIFVRKGEDLIACFRAVESIPKLRSSNTHLQSDAGSQNTARSMRNRGISQAGPLIGHWFINHGKGLCEREGIIHTPSGRDIYRKGEKTEPWNVFQRSSPSITSI